MKIYKITEDISLQFSPVSDYFHPKISHNGDLINIPLIVTEKEVETIVGRLRLINFVNLPLQYVKNIITGCISTVLKYGGNN